jgi:plasmid stabilization system protein ParE
MRYTVVYEDDAYDDIENTVAYLRHYYPSTPERFLAALEERIRAISDMHNMYPAYDRNPAYRKMLVQKNYLVFYKVNDAEQTIAIYRIFHGSRDFERYLP